MLEHTKRQGKAFFFSEMRLYFLMFITAVCFLFLLKLRWPKNKSIHDREFSFFYLNCNAVLTESAPGLFGYIRQIERVETIAKTFEVFGSHFESDVFLGVAVVVAEAP